jgi:hypothetical protein
MLICDSKNESLVASHKESVALYLPSPLRYWIFPMLPLAPTGLPYLARFILECEAF